MLILLQLNEIEVELRTTKVPTKVDGTLIRLRLDADQLSSKTWDATGEISENKVAVFFILGSNFEKFESQKLFSFLRLKNEHA